MENPELKPCPFCGSVLVRILGSTVFYGHCKHCDASSGLYASKEEAQNAWNTRAPVPNKSLREVQEET